MTIEERKQEIVKLTNELKTLVESRDVEAAKAKKEEIRKAKELLAIEQEIEEQEKRDLESQKGENRMETKKVSKELEYRALVKVMMGKDLTEEEKRAVTTANVVSNSGAILPEGFINQVQLLRKGYKALKDYTHVIPVATNTGKMPLATVGGELANLVEDTEMVKTMLTTTPVEYAVADYGLLKAVADNVLEDSPVDFIDEVLAVDFAEASVNTENKKIAALVNTNATVLTLATDVESTLEKQISKVVPSLRRGLVILTNSEGYAYIDNLKDNEGRRLDIVTTGSNGELYFKGKEVIDMDDTLLPTLTEGKKMVFYLVNLKALVKYFDRKTVEISRSAEAGWTYNQVFVKAIERFDLKKADVRACYKLEN